MYIRATGNISAQQTFGHPEFLPQVVRYQGNSLSCAEPDYRQVIDVKYIRRMSRIIKMGVAAALECLQEAGLEKPDAIITGTAYGCMEDTGIFLKKLVENKEELLTPTSFIQSTHNTVGAQIALIISCNEYNNTFVHRGFSFETALLDALMLIQEGDAQNVLVGSADEITGYSHAILSRFGLYKKELISNTDLYTQHSKGTIAGEGASFFVLSVEPANTDYATLDAMATFYKPRDSKEVEENINAFLNQHAINPGSIDLIIDGRNGDIGNDSLYDELDKSIFNNHQHISYKHLCGEYPTATSFAVWLAANILKNKALPQAFGNAIAADKKIKKILIYNHYLHAHHSLFLLSAC